MSGRINVPLRVAAVGATTALIGAMTSFPASAANGDVQVINTETVQVYTDASGKVETKRIYEQLSLTGTGNVDFANPVEADGLRNLDGFGGFDIEDGNQLVKVDVDGEKRLRTVSDFKGDLPLDIKVEYRLDGELVEPSDVVGENGDLEVKYIVKNVTAQEQEISIPDGSGGTVTKTVSVPIPMVGSLTTIVPSNYTDVASDAANMAGDGKGGTKLSFTMTLFPPVGSDTAEFGYTAKITDGVIPRTSISALPINPLESPTFASAATSYKGGADTGIELANGAGEIDSNLLKLRDGAGELLAGLIKLRNGAQQLEAGLAGEASPGANLLANGADELNSGLGELNAGSQRLAAGLGEASAGGTKLRDGAGKLADGAQRASTGSNTLADGAGQLAAGLVSAEKKAPALIDGLGELKAGLLLVDGGLKKLYTDIGSVPAKAQPLHDGIQQLLDGIGTETTANTLLFGVDQVRQGLTTALPKINAMATGVWNPLGAPGDPGAYQKLGCAIQVLTDLRDGTAPGTQIDCYRSATNPNGNRPGLPAFSPPADPTDPSTWDLDNLRYVTLKSVIDGLTDGRTKLATDDGATNETTLYGGLKTLLESLQHVPASQTDPPGAILALAAIQCGLDNASLEDEGNVPIPLDLICKRYPTGHPDEGEKTPGLKQGLQGLDAGITQLTTAVVETVRAGVGTANDTPADETLRGGMQGLISGARQLEAGGSTLIDGLGQLSDGAGQLDAGAGELSTGLGVLAAGADELGNGTVALENGLVQLADGSVELSDGAGRAADGSGQLADGANQLADGLTDAADGSGQLAEGLEQAADGAPALENGAQRLSDEGTKKLVEAGESTAQNYGELYEVIQAGAERAQDEKMVLGAPEDAIGLAAYSYEIKGEDGEGGRNLARGLGGLALLGAAGAAFALRRGIL